MQSRNLDTLIPFLFLFGNSAITLVNKHGKSGLELNCRKISWLIAIVNFQLENIFSKARKQCFTKFALVKISDFTVVM